MKFKGNYTPNLKNKNMKRRERERGRDSGTKEK